MKMKVCFFVLLTAVIMPVLTFATVSKSVSSSGSARTTTTNSQKTVAPQAATPEALALAETNGKSTKATVEPAAAEAPASNSINSRPIQVSSANPYFTITLPKNGSTGYTWYLKNYDARFILLVRHTVQTPKNAAIGAPVNEIWQFNVNPRAFIAPHMTMIEFENARPWNLNDHPSIVDFTVVTQ